MCEFLQHNYLSIFIIQVSTNLEKSCILLPWFCIYCDKTKQVIFYTVALAHLLLSHLSTHAQASARIERLLTKWQKNFWGYFSAAHCRAGLLAVAASSHKCRRRVRCSSSAWTDTTQVHPSSSGTLCVSSPASKSSSTCWTNRKLSRPSSHI